jgi:hypothetical protein
MSPEMSFQFTDIPSRNAAISAAAHPLHTSSRRIRGF